MASASSGLQNSDNESDELEEGEFVVEKIIDSRIEDGIEKFKIRWKGYSPSEDTWEPIDVLGKCTDMVEKFRQKRKQQQTKSRSKSKDIKRPVSKVATTASSASSSSSQSMPEWLKKYQPSTPKPTGPDEPGPSSTIKKRKSEDVPSSSRKKEPSDGNEKHGMGDSTAPSSKKDRPEKNREEERREKKSDGPSTSHQVEKPSRSDGEKKKEKSASLGAEKKLEKTSEKPEKSSAGGSKSEKSMTSGGSEKKKEKPSIEEKKSEKPSSGEKKSGNSTYSEKRLDKPSSSDKVLEKPSTVEKNVEKIKIKKDKLKTSDQAGKSSSKKKQPTPAEKEREESSSGTSTPGIVNLIDSIVSNKPYHGPTQFFPPPVVRDQESAGTSSATSEKAKEKLRTAEVNQGSMTPGGISREERSSSGIEGISSSDRQRMETSASVVPTPSNPGIVAVDNPEQQDQQQPIEAMEMGVDIGPKTSTNRKEGISSTSSSSSTQKNNEPMEPPIAEENATPLVDQMDYEDAQDQPLEIEMPLIEQQSVDGDSVFSDTPQEEHLPAKKQNMAPKALAAVRLAKIYYVKKTEQRLTGRQMLFNAVRDQNYPEVKRLVTELDSEQLKVNQLTPDGKLHLLQLCAKRQDKPSRANCRILKILIERCSALKYENTFGANPAIFSVCKLGSPCCLRTLLVYEQIDVNAIGENGETALFAAIRRRNKRMVRDLINNGACLNKRNAQNMSAMDLIKELLDAEPVDPTLLKIHQEMSAFFDAINEAIGQLTKSILEHQCDQIVPIFDFHLVTRMNEIGHLEPASREDGRPLGVTFDYPPVGNLDDDGDLSGSIAIVVMYVIRFEPTSWTMSWKQAVEQKRMVCCNGSFESDIGRGCKNTIFSLSHTKGDGMNRLNITMENQLGRKEALVFRGYRVRVKTSAVADARSDNPAAPGQSVSSVTFANPNYSSESEDEEEDSNDDNAEVTTGETHDEREESGEEEVQSDEDEDNRMDQIKEGVVGDQPQGMRNVEQLQSGQEEADVQMEEEVRVEEPMQEVRLVQVDDGNDSDGSESDDYEEEQGIGEAAGYDCIRQLVREMVDIIELSSEGPGSVEHRLAIDDDLE